MKCVFFTLAIFFCTSCGHIPKKTIFEEIQTHSKYSHFSSKCGLYDSKGELISKKSVLVDARGFLKTRGF